MPATSTNAREHYSGSEADEDDPVWIPGKRPDQRRVRHKYSARTERMTGKKRARLAIHSPEAPRTLPGAIELATPVITGKRWEMPSSARSQPSVEQRKAPPPQEQQAFRDRYSLHKSHWQQLMDESGDPGFADIARNLDRVLQNFLYNTRITPHETNPGYAKLRLGARSLLSMVVRRLPQYIAMEQDVQDELDPDADEDMCDAYFTELESFYAPHGKGWRPLREAVRAQGIHLISMMIQNKWLSDTVIHALLEKCRHHEWDACELLLSTVLSERTHYPLPQALMAHTCGAFPGDPVRVLHKFASQDQPRRTYRSYLFGELSKLFKRGVLPPEWMVTRPWTAWMTRATISFSREESDCFSASDLLQAVLVSASGIHSNVAIHAPQRKRPTKHDHAARSTRKSSTLSGTSKSTERKCPVPVEDALSNQVTSLLAAICGMHISRSRISGIDNGAHSTKAGHLIEHVSFAVRKEMDATPLSDVSTLPTSLLLRRGCILLADCLLQCNDAILVRKTQPIFVSSAGIEEYSRVLTPRGDVIKDLALFVRQACRCFGSTSNEEDTFMASEVRRMVSRLPHLAEHSQLARFLSRVAVETAMEFAEGTGEPDDHVWAIEIQETAMSLREQRESTSDTTESEPEVPAQRQGLYRWEDSIGEWVARTPAVKPSNTITIGRKRRASERSLEPPCVPCSTGSSSPEPDCFEETASSFTSSPSSIGARDAQAIETSPTRPAKRPRRAAPMVVVEQTQSPPQSPVSASTRSRSPSLEPVPSHRRVLRDLSNRLANKPPAPAEPQPTSKVEVVIINNRSSRPEPARAPIERAEKRVNRSMNRRRPGRPSISRPPAPAIAARRQSVIPCSQDDDSEDELSFM